MLEHFCYCLCYSFCTCVCACVCVCVCTHTDTGLCTRTHGFFLLFFLFYLLAPYEHFLLFCFQCLFCVFSSFYFISVCVCVWVWVWVHSAYVGRERHRFVSLYFFSSVEKAKQTKQQQNTRRELNINTQQHWQKITKYICFLYKKTN